MNNTTEKVTKTNRHYGEGSIYQHKDGRWVAKYRDEAMAKPQYLYGSTEAEVRRKLRDWKKQTARGLTACKKVFFRDYADNWFYTFKQHSVENSSFDRYESIYLHHIKPVLGDIQIASIRSEEIQNLLVAYKERFDKDNFIKNQLLDNLLLVDIYSRSKKLRIKMEAPRTVMIIEAGEGKDANSVEVIRVCLGNGNRDFITAVDENSVIVVKEILEEVPKAELERVAKSIITTLEKEGASDVHIAYGSIVGELKEVSRSYKAAEMALDVGKIFFGEREIMSYSELGIGRLIYQLPIPLCRMFIKEIFDGQNPDDFDEETLTTINKFFENSLNVSETSRQLFIHRNTLVYRLDKIQKNTGLDLRVFDDAITFKIALMIRD